MWEFYVQSHNNGALFAQIWSTFFIFAAMLCGYNLLCTCSRPMVSFFLGAANHVFSLQSFLLKSIWKTCSQRLHPLRAFFVAHIVTIYTFLFWADTYVFTKSKGLLLSLCSFSEVISASYFLRKGGITKEWSKKWLSSTLISAYSEKNKRYDANPDWGERAFVSPRDGRCSSSEQSWLTFISLSYWTLF